MRALGEALDGAIHNSMWATSAALLAGAYLAGLLPLILRNEGFSRVSLVLSTAGTGLLLGSGLGVVLPEGFLTFAALAGGKDGSGGLPEWTAGAAVLLGFALMLVLHEVWMGGSEGHGHSHPSAATAKHKDDDDESFELQQLLHPPSVPSEPIGAGIAGTGSPGERARLLGGAAAASRVSTAGASDSGTGRSSAGLMLVALLVHSGADGIAVGAASLTSSLSLNLSVAAAILLHKLPVSFGLTSLLRSAGWPLAKAHNGLIAFSAAAPAGAILTHYVVGALGSSVSQAPALAVLFSGGTLLYAINSLLVSPLGHGADGASPGAGSGAGPPGGSRGQLTLLGLGALIPLIIAAAVPEE